MNTSFNSTQNLPPSDNNREVKSIKLLQQCLEVTEARNRQLLASLPQIVWFSQVNGEITEFNQRWYEYTGLTAQASLGWEFLKILHTEDRDRFVAAFNLSCQTPQTYELECRLLGVEGYHWFVAQVSPLIDAKGQIKEWIGIYTLINKAENITPPLNKAEFLKINRSETQTQAIQSDELAKYRFRNLSKELSHTIVWEANATNPQYTFVSQSAEKVLGYPIQKWLTEPNFWVNLIHPEDRQWTVALSNKEIGHSRDYELEYRCLAADNRVVWLRDRACIIRDEQGQISKRRGMMVDITLTKHAEAELLVRKRQQTVIAQLGQKARLDNQVSTLMSESVALVSQALAVEYCKVLEYLPDQQHLQFKAGVGWRDGLVGQAMIEASPNTHAGYALHCRQPIVLEDLRREKRFRGSALLQEHSVVSGVSVVIEAKPETSTGYKSKSAQPFGVLGAHSSRRRKFSRSDVDFLQAVAHILATAIANQQSDQELVEARRQLAQTQAALEKCTQEFEQFAYIASHDLKAPLRAIANLSQWLEEDIGEQLNSENRQQMQLLRGRVYRLEAMIEGLLQFSRTSRVKTELEWVDVGALLAEVIETLAPPADFTIKIAPRMPRLYTDRLRLRQVFQHLLKNAIIHHPSSRGTVKITVKQKLGCYQFTVSDDGAGIAPQFQERVFEIFQTLEGRDIAENVGMGLAIVKKIVESQGGTIQLDSQEGKGTCFSFTW
jgi:PAS domain S-box-containing protein